MTEKTERHLYIASGSSGERTKMIQCAYEIGAFAAVASIQCEVSYPEQWYGPGQAIKVTYWDDHAYTALRIQFGHRFVTPDPEPVKDMTPFTTAAKIKQSEWHKILKYAAQEDDLKAKKQDEHLRYILRQKLASTSRY